jgi:adenosylmethionine-8-amino-7-oxononanoate aminotransferase
LFTNPPLCITEDQLREGVAIIDRALEATDAALAGATRREVHQP